jgi:oligo-alginate lyase
MLVMKIIKNFGIAILLLAVSTMAISQKLPNPKLFIRNGKVVKVENPLVKQTESLLIKLADSMLQMSPPERIMEGKRLLTTSRLYLKRIGYLAYAFRITGDRKYQKQAEAYLLKACTFADWNPSHFLDVAEMTAALSVGVDWLGKSLSVSTKNAVIDAIVKKGLNPSYDKNYNSWVNAENNWNQVCNASMFLGAIVVQDKYPALADSTIKRAKKSIQIPQNTYNPDGVYPEGTMYWGYGTTFNVLFFDAYEKIFPDSTLKYADGFLKSGQFILHAHSELGSFNFSDNRQSEAKIEPAMFWMANKAKSNEILYFQMNHLRAMANGKIPFSAKDISDRFLPFLIIWLKEINIDAIPAPARLAWLGTGNTPVSTMRSGWNTGDFFVGVKGGSPSANHAHMDVGSFVFDANGVRWANDLGMHEYGILEANGMKIWDKNQKADRWRIFRYNNFSHNTLVVDSLLQLVDANAPITNFIDTDSLKSASVDISSAYRNSLNNAVRTISLVNNSKLIIRDSLQNDNTVSHVRWSMLTFDTIELLSLTTALIRKNGKTMLFKIMQPQNATIKQYSAQPSLDFEEKNKGFVMIGFDQVLQPNESRYVQVELIPQNE